MKKRNRKDLPLVSIITPSYNQWRFIEETIKSVLDQDYPNIEYIVIDGGSTDNTVEILKRYGDSLKWITGEDKGQSDAINKGFQMASGEIFAWINSDDIYLPGAVSKIADFFCRHKDIDVVYGKSRYINIDGESIGEYPTEAFNYEKLATFDFISQPSAFFRKKAWKEIGGLDVDLHYCLDYDLWIRMAKKFRFAYLEEELSSYRVHRDAKSVPEENAVSLHAEILETVMKHYSRAPLNRVLGYSYHSLKSMLPDFFSKIDLALVLLLPVTFTKYISLNRCVRLEDIKMINVKNFKKILDGWELRDLLKNM